MEQHRKIAVIGLGYVGLPVAVAFGKNAPVIGFDVNAQRIAALKEGNDWTHEVTIESLKTTQIVFTSNPADLKEANFFIICVPTPIDEARQPDLSLMIRASETVGQYLKAGDIVVYESTVYPGATEERCIPVLETQSGLRFNQDFFVGYSPERINPGDKSHTFETIQKVVSGSTPETLSIVSAVYGSVVKAGVYEAQSIKVAEAAKVIENTQRDLNIALINELALIFKRMGIDTQAVLAAAGTKWNFLPFQPGLVGGHCIGVDPYYLAYKAKSLGYRPEVIMAGRRTNDSMGKFVAEQTVKELIKAGCCIKGAKVGILGFTFKEDCPDVRNTRVIDIVRELEDFGVTVSVHDPVADAKETHHEYGIELVSFSAIKSVDALILAVAHREFKLLSASDLESCYGDHRVLMDIKAIYNLQLMQDAGLSVWRL